MRIILTGLTRRLLPAAVVVIGVLAAGLATAAVAAPTTVAPEPAGVAAPAAVALRFDPPLDRPIAYDFEQRRSRGGVTEMTLRSRDELTFTRDKAGDQAGFLLTWVTRSIAVDAPGPVRVMLEKVFGLGVGRPLLIAVTPEGAAEAVRNAGEVRTLTEAMFAQLLATIDAQLATVPPETRATLGKMMSALLDQQRQQSDADFAQSLLDGPNLMLPGLPALVPGERHVVTVERPSPLGGGTLHFLAAVELRRVDAASAELVVSSVVEPEDARRVAAAVIAAMVAAIPDPEQRRQLAAKTAELGSFAVDDEAVITIARPSGVTQALRYRKTVRAPGRPEQVETRSYVRAP